MSDIDPLFKTDLHIKQLTILIATSLLALPGIAKSEIIQCLHEITWCSDHFARTPEAYDKFLRYATVGYFAVLIVAIPGVIGVISIALSSFVIGGIYLLVRDMDQPLGYDEQSFVDARLDALHCWNSRHDQKDSP